MFTMINSFSVIEFIIINILIIIGSIFCIIKGKRFKKYYTPIFYLIIVGSIICTLYKGFSSNNNTNDYSSVFMIILFVYLAILLISFIKIGIIGLKNKNIQIKNKNQIITGIILIIVGIIMIFIVPILIQRM